MKLAPAHSATIIKEMCKRVGVTPDQIDFTKDHWYHSHEWTESEEDSFVAWLATFLAKKKITTKMRALHEAKKIVFNYGWRTKYVS